MNGTKVLKDVTAKQVTLRDGFRPSVKKVKIDSEDTSDFAICGLNNVISTANLIPPRWYDETKSGYVYLWINLTNLEKNKSI